MPWLPNPEIEFDKQKIARKKERFFRGVSLMSVMLAITAALFFIIGLANITSDIFAFLLFSLIMAPSVGIFSTVYIFMWRLMKDVSYISQ
jgi:hypothetical protein